MRYELRRAGLDPAAEALALRALIPDPETVHAPVREILAAVRARGDDAVREYTARFDSAAAAEGPLRVAPAALTAALAGIAPDLRAGLQAAIANVGAVADAALVPERRPVSVGVSEIVLRRVPVRRAAVYVPGGRAPYPSTVVMGGVTARVAGVAEVVVCAPPGPEGEIHPAILAACALTEVDEVYRMGGAQAIAALAYGTASVPAADVIVGPGNLYVQEAKHQASERVGIDGFAGPSDLVLIAEPGADRLDPRPLALDLLAQAEHGAGSLVVALSSDPGLLAAIAAELADAAEHDGVISLLQTASPEDGLALAEAFAPEHLQLVGGPAEALSRGVTRAGCLFVGPEAGTAFGDYIAGSNHVLPTAGAARFASGLSPAHFSRAFAEVRITDPGTLARAAAPIARAEGFEEHARSMEARIEDNRD